MFAVVVVVVIARFISTKSRTGHLVEDFFDVAIVVEIDTQIPRRVF
jgi:hypothetical protein